MESEKARNEVLNIGEKLEEIKDINSVRKTKREPEKVPIIFSESPLQNVFCFSVFDNAVYVIGINNKLEKYIDVADNTITESGIVWDTENWGEPISIKVNPNGVVVFTKYDTSDTVRIYHLDNINDNTPNMAYESPSAYSGSWAGRNAFGIKQYYTGLNTYILAGVYGFNGGSRDLLLSKDGGKSFEVIKTTQNADSDPNENSHWHDVAFDVYHGIIWASEGDNQTNRQIIYSADFGENWYTLSNDRQPTAILPFSDVVVFGRDSGTPGFDFFSKNKIEDNNSYDFQGQNVIGTLREFKFDTHGFNYYAKSPVIYGSEGYVSFLSVNTEPTMIMATGDAGDTWYFLHFGHGAEHSGNIITGLQDIDENYIYGYGNTGGAGNKIVYAEKIKWLQH